MRNCELCGTTEAIHKHHVVGRVGPDKDRPENLIDLCWACHHRWHNNRTPGMEDAVYGIMKSKHGDRFPIKVNGHPKKPKWLIAAEGRTNGRLSNTSPDEE